MSEESHDVPVVPSRWWERRGTMVYTEDKGPGTAQLVAECRTSEQAQRIVDAHNDCGEQL